MSILDEVYEDQDLVEWVENASRERLELICVDCEDES